MKAPVKPIKPVNPNPPNKNQKYHQHFVNIKNLFMKDVCFDDDFNEKEIPNGFDYNKEEWETREFAPSLRDLLNAVPDNVSPEHINIQLHLGYDSGRNYVSRPFENIVLRYNTPYNYEEELAKYNVKFKEYGVALNKYNHDLVDYKVKYEKYKAEKTKLAVQKKKEKLKAELDALNNI